MLPSFVFSISLGHPMSRLANIFERKIAKIFPIFPHSRNNVCMSSSGGMRVCSTTLLHLELVGSLPSKTVTYFFSLTQTHGVILVYNEATLLKTSSILRPPRAHGVILMSSIFNRYFPLESSLQLEAFLLL
jgi:hypothetical protein